MREGGVRSRKWKNGKRRKKRQLQWIIGFNNSASVEWVGREGRGGVELGYMYYYYYYVDMQIYATYDAAGPS